MTEYEHMIKEFMPALRASAAKMMYKNRIKQEDIAEFLGITQAAVSKYISGNYSETVKIFESKLDKKEVAAFVERIVHGKLYESQRVVCKMCARDLSFDCNLMVK
jgi:predicted transcriptional regulator